MHFKHAVQSMSVLLTSSLVCTQAVASSTYVEQQLDPLTVKVSQLVRQDKLQEAIELEQKAIDDGPRNWLAHAMLSYLYWQQGNVLAASDEANAAASVSPDNEIALLNLARTREALDDCAGAAQVYEQARVIAPNDWEPWLGLARCRIKSGNEPDGYFVLQEMAARPTNSFEWYQELGDIYLTLDKPALAIEATIKATKLARNSAQKAANKSQLYMALLRDNQLQQARILQKEVFDNCRPNQYEYYVRTAASLLSANHPSGGKALVNAAIKNLTTPEAAEGFFRLGRIFEQKAAEVSDHSTTRSAWLAQAGDAYRRAIALCENQPQALAMYHVALVGVLEHESDIAGMTKELEKAQALDQFSHLAPFLRSRIGVGTFQVQAVSFRVNGLTCACQISRAEEAVSKVTGVGFVHIPAQTTPYQGTMLVDANTVSVKEALNQAAEDLRAAYAAAKHPLDVRFDIESIKTLDSVANAVKIAQESEHGDLMNFFRSFKPVSPTMPVSSLFPEKVSFIPVTRR